MMYIRIFIVTIYFIGILAVDQTESTAILEEIIRIANETVTFKCPKDDNVEWTVRSKDSNEFRPMSDLQIFEIRNLSTASEGVYACYSSGQLVSAYKLTIYEPPSFRRIKQMIQQLVVKPTGNMVQLKCPAAGHPTPNITWLKNGKTPIRSWRELEYKHWSLTLEDLTTDDEGNYTCVICNVVGCIDYTYRLYVVERYHNKPVLTKTLENITATLGSNVSFECKFLPDLNPIITWMSVNDGNEVGDNDTVVQSPGDSLHPEILEITNVTFEDQGWYACIGANFLGHTISKAYLTVVDVPSETAKNITISFGSDASFECKFLSDFHPTWIRLSDGNEVGDDNTAPGNSVLEITNGTFQGQGWYACVAANSFGKTVFKVYLTAVDV